MWNKHDITEAVALGALAVVTALVIVGSAHSAVTPGRLAQAIDRINHATLGYPKAHTVCTPEPSHPGRAVCTVNLGRPNLDIGVVPIGARCFRAEFWQTGGIVHIRVPSVVRVPCRHAAGAAPSS